MSNRIPASDPDPSVFDARLCMVKHDIAYFTHHSLGDVRGDDWDDAPYEHNAGAPYEEFVVLEVRWEGPFDDPCAGRVNSEFTVDSINVGAIAWLRPHRWVKGVKPLKAGTTFREFVEAMQAAKGRIFVLMEIFRD